MQIQISLSQMDIEGLFFDTSDYELQKKKLGEGTFGTVYTAKCIKDGKLYACKIIKVHDGFKGHDQMLLMRESLTLHKLRHPGIVEFKGVNFQSFTEENRLEPSIITEYIKGGSLKTILDQGKNGLASHDWTPTKKYILLLEIVNAMSYLHEQGIIHRDLKPENILIDEELHPRICDFGLSRCFNKSLTKSDKLTMTGQVGTPIYMAPEILAGDTHYGPGVDVYSFSMIAYELVTGKVPYSELPKDMTAVSLGIKVTEGYRPIIPEFVPEKMQQLIRRCWSEKATERPSFKEIFNELSNDIDDFIDETVEKEDIDDFIDSLKSQTKNPSDLIEENSEHGTELSELKKKLSGYTTSENLFISGIAKLYGHKKERNKEEGIHDLMVSSEKGNCHSSLFLGLLYEAGDFVDSDFNEVQRYFERSSLQGNIAGYHLIGWCYKSGFFEEKKKPNYSKALEYYQKAADLGYSTSINNIGYFYEKGFGVKQDYSKALEYYQKAADLGYSIAFNNIGLLYEKGLGVKQDYSKALEYYQKAVNLGNEGIKKHIDDLQEQMRK